MYATDSTWRFKTTVMTVLQSSSLGYDTRYAYYQKQFPDMPVSELYRLICDPIEYYDQDWPCWQLENKNNFEGEDELVTAFFLKRDRSFQAEAQAAIFGFDEAGFGTGVNVMRFVHLGKPVLGFYNPDCFHGGHNIHNVMQLAMDYPDVVTLCRYRDVNEIAAHVVAWLGNVVPSYIYDSD